MTNQIHPTDLTDSQWNLIKELIPGAKVGGRPRSLDMRLVINAIFYVVVGGIKWRMMPREYPKWKSIDHYFRQRRLSSDWQRLHATLRAEVRAAVGRHKHPSAGCLDSQSVKTTEIEGIRGYDAAKRIKGRKYDQGSRFWIWSSSKEVRSNFWTDRYPLPRAWQP